MSTHESHLGYSGKNRVDSGTLWLQMLVQQAFLLNQPCLQRRNPWSEIFHTLYFPHLPHLRRSVSLLFFISSTISFNHGTLTNTSFSSHKNTNFMRVIGMIQWRRFAYVLEIR